MIKKLTAILIVCIAIVSINEIAAIEFEYSTNESIAGLPSVTSLHHVAPFNLGVAIIGKDRKSLRIFHPNNTSETIQVDEGNRIFYVSSPPNTNLILTAESLGNGKSNFKWVARDTSGNIEMGPLYTNFTVSISPCRQYFYSSYDVGNDLNRPAVFNSNGELLTRLESSSGNWDIAFMDRQRMLYRDGGDVYVYSVPDFHIINKISVGPIRNADLPKSSISPDGVSYTFQSRDEVYVLRLTDSRIFRLKKAKHGGVATYPSLLLSESGKYLAIFGSHDSTSYVDIYQNRESDYTLLQKEIEILKG